MKLHTKLPQVVLSRCLVCKDSGILPESTGTFPEMIFYTFCRREGPKFCTCPAGEKAFFEWCKSPEIREAIVMRRQRQVGKTLEMSCIPYRWSDNTLDDLKASKVVHFKLSEYFQNFQNFRKEGRGIYVYGEGDGKTIILTLFLNEIIKKYAIPSIFMTERQIYRKISQSFNTPELAGITRRVQNVECLFIDDLAAEFKITPWKLTELTDIIEHRYHNRLPTFITSNYSLENYERFIARSHATHQPNKLPSCIHKMCKAFIFEATNISLK